MARDTKETSLAAARALFSKRPEPVSVPEPSRIHETGMIFEYLPETADWIPPGCMIAIEGRKLDERLTAEVREAVEALSKADAPATLELPEGVSVRFLPIPIQPDSPEPAQAPTIIGGVDWATKPATLTVWSCPTELRQMNDEYPYDGHLSEKQMKGDTLGKFDAELKRQFDAGEIVGRGDAVVEMDRNIFKRRYETHARVKVALPPNDVDFSVIGGSDSIEAVRVATSRILREQPEIQTVEVLPPQMFQAPNQSTSVKNVKEIIGMLDAGVISPEQAKELFPVGIDPDVLEATRRSSAPTERDCADFATQLQQDPVPMRPLSDDLRRSPPIHPHCRTKSAIVDADPAFQLNDRWTNGSEVVQITASKIAISVQEGLREGIRVKHFRGHATYEETIPLEQFKRGWWRVDGQPD